MNSTNPENSFGKFGVRAFTAGSAYPVADAIVIIRKKSSDKSATVAVLETDESGKTPIITLPTPPKSLSLSPGATIAPYALYDVEISHKDFYTTITRDVQVYPDTTSILPINMLPLPDTVYPDKEKEGQLFINSGEKPEL